jgi:hypothetical protein
MMSNKSNSFFELVLSEITHNISTKRWRISFGILALYYSLRFSMDERIASFAIRRGFTPLDISEYHKRAFLKYFNSEIAEYWKDLPIMFSNTFISTIYVFVLFVFILGATTFEEISYEKTPYIKDNIKYVIGRTLGFWLSLGIVLFVLYIIVLVLSVFFEKGFVFVNITIPILKIFVTCQLYIITPVAIAIIISTLKYSTTLKTLLCVSTYMVLWGIQSLVVHNDSIKYLRWILPRTYDLLILSPGIGTVILGVFLSFTWLMFSVMLTSLRLRKLSRF